MVNALPTHADFVKQYAPASADVGSRCRCCNNRADGVPSQRSLREIGTCPHLLPADVRHPGDLPAVRLAGAPVAAPAAGDRRDDRRRGARPLLVRRGSRRTCRRSCFRRNRRRCCTSWRSSASGCTCFSSASISAATTSRRTRRARWRYRSPASSCRSSVAIAGTPWLMSVPGLFAADVSQFNATLFLGAAIAITAFPVLARIIHDRGLNGSLIATLSLSAAAIGDAIAWCVLAVVLASLGAGPGVAVIAIVGGIVLVGRDDLAGAAIVRAARAPGRARARGRSAAEHHGARGRADAVHAVRVLRRCHRPARGVRRLPDRHRHAARRVRRSASSSCSSRSRWSSCCRCSSPTRDSTRSSRW